jgi:hypothetical protein
MSNWRKIANRSTVLFCVLLSVFAVARSQTRENNRTLDEYDRTLNLMKNDAKAARERRRNLFPQINDDFQRIQIIHNEMVRMLQPDKSLNYDRLADLTDDMKKRGTRLRENLALPEPEKTEAERTHSEPVDEIHLKRTIADLHDVVVRFVANPIFKNLGVVDTKEVDAATNDLHNIINLSDEIKRDAKTLGKSAKN